MLVVLHRSGVCNIFSAHPSQSAELQHHMLLGANSRYIELLSGSSLFSLERSTVACRSYLLQAETARSLSQAFSGGLPSPACAISISAAPAAISQMDLSASSVTLTQPAASSASASSVPPAVAAQHAHLGSDADSQPVPSPNYRMDHVLADSLHSRLHASHDFGPMSLVSAMSNDENLTPAASTDFSQAARPVFQRADAVQEAAPEVHSLLYCNAQECRPVHASTPTLAYTVPVVIL